jgi:5,6-dimethylbenzimidazole synthase
MWSSLISPPSRPNSISEPPLFDALFQARLTDLFRWRRDVRHFRADPVPDDVVESLLALADLAPSVGLSQPWRFVTVDDPNRRAAVRASFAACNAVALAAREGDEAGLYARLKLAGLDDAPRQFALFCDGDPVQGRGLGRATMPETLDYSAVMAVHTLWLAARAWGLGLGWVSILDPVAVHAALDVPRAWRFIGYFCLGVPVVDSRTPELEECGWERRSPVASHRLRR